MSIRTRIASWIGGTKSSAAFGSPEFYAMLSGAVRTTKAGVPVNVERALQVVTVLACVRVIAEGIAQVPLKLQQDVPGGEKRRKATEHPLYRLLHLKPNGWMTSFELREFMAVHAVLTGNAYAYLNRVGRDNRIAEIIPVDSRRCQVKQADDLTLNYLIDGKEFPASQIWHVRGLSLNGHAGLDAVQLAREAIGLAIAAEDSQALMHANGVQNRGVLSVDGKLSDQQYHNLRNHIVRNATGVNAGLPLIVDNGAKWLQTQWSGVDAQHLETRRMQVEQICSALRVLPIMIGFADKTATYASAEQMFLAHLTHTLAPWYTRFEQSMDAQLLTPKEVEQGYYTNFVEEGLLRADSKATSENLARLTSAGILTRNEARDKLDLNPLDGLDEPLTPSNMVTGAEDSAPPKDPAPGA